MHNTLTARDRLRTLVVERARRSRPARTWERRTGFVACVWMTVFAGFHTYWALGGTLGLPPHQSLVDNKPLFVIDMIAIPMNLVGAVGALALVQDWGMAFPRRFVLGGAWFCAVLMICHSAPSMVDLAVFLTGQRDKPLTGDERFSVLLYEPYWMLGGILFTFLARGFQRRTRRSYGAIHAEAA
ncbi:DUF3995 domain-containing protein [Streptomyces sp. tea 10]|nr:DUF3995 domain-containing protein [Streptomyces sp. tea 10]